MTVREPDPADRRRNGPPGADTDVTRRAERTDHSAWNWLLLLPLVATLYPPIYNRIKPLLFDIPFFYWYQLAAILLSVIVTVIVYRKTRA
jgi:hypothetical protein